MIHVAFSVLHSYDDGLGSETATASLYFSVAPGIIGKLIKPTLPREPVGEGQMLPQQRKAARTVPAPITQAEGCTGWL